MNNYIFTIFYIWKYISITGPYSDLKLEHVNQTNWLSTIMNFDAMTINFLVVQQLTKAVIVSPWHLQFQKITEFLFIIIIIIKDKIVNNFV